MKRFHDVRPGQEIRIRADEWNQIRRAANDWLDGDGADSFMESRKNVAPIGQVNMFNNANRSAPAFGVLKVSGAMYKKPSTGEQLRNAHWPGIEVFGTAPQDEEDEILCVVTKTIQTNKIGRGVVFGPVCVWCDVKDTGHCYAKPVKDCVETLISAETGPVRLMVPVSETGPQICYAFLGLPAGEPTVNAKELFPACLYRPISDQDDREERQNKINQAQATIDDKQEEINAKQEEIDAKQGEINAKQEEIRNKNKEINEKSGEIRDKEKDVKEKKDRIESKQQEILLLLETENQEMVAELEAEIAELEAEIADLETEIADLRTEIDDLRTEIDDLRTEIAELKAEIAELRRDLETYIICPGGRGADSSIKTVHVLHVDERKVSTSTFGALPMAMSNFAAVLADNGYGDPMLVCAPGEVDEGSRYPVQRYEFSQELWSKSDTTQSLAGCPGYVVDGKMIVAGGQSAYYVSSPVPTAGSLTTQFYGHHTTPFWSIDPIAGTLETRIPSRLIVSGTTPQPESNVANQQKRFLKQNFSGVFLGKTGQRPVEFVAVGGTELLGYQANAVVSYALESTGPILDCENANIRIGGDCEVFPDTPFSLGECGAVRIKRRRSGNRIIDCDLLVCIGGRYRDENGKFVFHQRPWSLNMENTAEGWRNDLFPELPTPRFNAALSDVVTVMENILDDDGNDTGETREVDRVFLIGGRTEDGLTASIEALNLTDMKWETDWPGLDGKIPKQDEDE